MEIWTLLPRCCSARLISGLEYLGSNWGDIVEIGVFGTTWSDLGTNWRYGSPIICLLGDE